MYYIKHKGNVETAVRFNGQVQCSCFEALQPLVYTHTHTHTETPSSEIFCSHTVLQICIAFNPKRAALEYQPSPAQFSPSQLWKYLWLKIKMLLNEIFFFHMVNSLDFSVPQQFHVKAQNRIRQRIKVAQVITAAHAISSRQKISTASFQLKEVFPCTGKGIVCFFFYLVHLKQQLSE